jgi:GntR family transcriptional regulator
VAQLEINVSSPIPVYQQIMDGIRRLVSEEAMASGAPLPSVRQLAAELAINPNTVAKAYQFLEREGTIVTRRRRGAFVGESSAAMAALARERRLGEVVNRFVEDARRLGVGKEEIIQAVAERVLRGGEREGHEGDAGVEGADAAATSRPPAERPETAGEEPEGVDK